jgi:type IV secretion system protein VirB4
MVTKIQHQADKKSWEGFMKDAFEDIEEMTERILAGFANYSAELLEIKESENGFFSEILEFLARIVNCGNSQPMLIPLGDIAHHLPLNKIYFGNKSIEIHTLAGVKYAGLVSVKEYRPSTHSGILDGFMHMPFELIISQ